MFRCESSVTELTDKPSLQINVAIIAACATSLKPLVSRLLGLGTTQRYPTPGSYGYDRGTRGTRPNKSASASASATQTDEYELDDSEKGLGGGHKHPHDRRSAVPPGTATSFYKHSPPDGSGSEEMILGHGMSSSPPAVAIGGMAGRAGHGANVKGNGIVRTTEVEVVYK